MIISLIVFGIEYFVYKMNSKRISDITPGIKPSIKPGIKTNIKPGIKASIKPGIKPGMKQGIKSDVKTDIKIDKKNKVLLKDKAPPKNNVILILPEASNLFQQVLMTKRYQ